MPSYASASLALAASLFFSSVSAHTYLIQPKTRLAFAKGFGDALEDGTGSWDGLCHIGDGTPVCCNTQKMSASQQTTYKRGQEVDTHWWRNNHAGGFTRYSIVPIDDSDDQANFDSAENVRSYGCNQVGCSETYGGESPNNWNGGDSNGNKGWSNICAGSFKVPYDLEDGQYTLQWIWFGTGNAPSANSPFQGCVDFTIKGGPTGAKPKCPLWKGGDLSEKSKDACSFVSVNNPTYQGVCASANACQGSYQVGVPKAIQQCYSGESASTYPLEMVTAPKGFPDTYTNYKASGSSKSGSTSKSGSKSKSKSKSKSSSSSSDGDDDSSSSSSSSKKTSKKTSSSSSSDDDGDDGSNNYASLADSSDSKNSSRKSSKSCMRKRAHSRRSPSRLGKTHYSI